MSIVLVTGGSGFIGSHIILQLLQAGHLVRTTVRSLGRAGDVRAMLQAGGVEAGDRLSFFAADLMRDDGWAEAAAGCDYVLHVASPLPAGEVRDENELIVPAREGTLRVLRAARDAGVKRVVLTSSFAAIGYGHAPQAAPFTEADWTNLDVPLPAYVKSKTIAERAAWDFMAREGGSMELTTINPVGVFGPVLGSDYSASIHLLKQMMDGKLPVCPNLSFGVVDVRDVAGLHIRAMTDPAAKGERFLATSGHFMRLAEIGHVLKTQAGASKAPTRQIPDWLVRLIAVFVPAVRSALSELGKNRDATNDKAVRVLGWNPRSPTAAIVATADSLRKLSQL